MKSDSKQKAWAKRLLDNYKLTIEQWSKIFAYQGECCVACGQLNKSGVRLSVDHDHKTGLIRGLLCHRCNRLLGKIESPRWQATPALLRKLADYWENPSAPRALDAAHYGYTGRVGTKTHRKLLKKLARQADRTKIRDIRARESMPYGRSKWRHRPRKSKQQKSERESS